MPEFKKHACVNIDQAIPKIKTKDESEDISDHLADKIRLNKRKRRRFKRSFYYAKNLIQWSEDELNCEEPKNYYKGTTLQYFELKERRFA